MKRNWTAAVALTVTVGVAHAAWGQAYPEYDDRQQEEGYPQSGQRYDDDRYERESPQSQERQREDREAYRAQQERAADRDDGRFEGEYQQYGSQSYDRRADRGRSDELDYRDSYDARSTGQYQRESVRREASDERRYERDSLGTNRQRGRQAAFSEEGQRRPSGRVRDAISEWASDWWSDDEPQQPDTGIDASSARQFIEQHDTDDDGYLSWSELPRDLRSSFNQLDRDGDGYLSERELRQHALRHARARVPVEVTYIWIVGADRGRVDLEDLNRAYSLMRRIDTDGDGYIARSELRDRQQQVLSQWLNQTFMRLDRDDDDRISREEARGSVLGRNFDQLDADGDGKLSRSELREALRQQPGLSAEPSDRSAAVPRSGLEGGYRDDYSQDPQDGARYQGDAGYREETSYEHQQRSPDRTGYEDGGQYEDIHGTGLRSGFGRQSPGDRRSGYDDQQQWPH